MSPRWDGTPTHKERVAEFFAGRENEWLTPPEVATAIGLTTPQVRSAITNLLADGFLTRGVTGVAKKRRQFRTKRGFMRTSKFLAREYPGVIWVGEEPIVGPFCQHCGNPDYMHGPKQECLNYRIHPLLPPGDLPPATRRLA